MKSAHHPLLGYPTQSADGSGQRIGLPGEMAQRLYKTLEPLAHPILARRPPRTVNPWLAGLGLCAGLGMLALLTRVARRPQPSRIDVALTRLLQRREPPLVTRALALVSAPGFAPLEHAITFGVALDLWALGHRREAIFALLTMGAGATTGVIKIVVDRPRPDPAFMRSAKQFRDKSFPSGHCTHYASFYGYLGYLAYRTMPPSPLRRLILGLCGGLIVLVAPSRVYLGHHWSSDVLAGEIVGLSYLFVLTRVYENVLVRRDDGSGPATEVAW